ncbi:hypothetical protein DFH06DRAFT_1483270 [Mycena polygramma]|nr:hypothetical protein DFH06DRAFT_1483270 [Mycena polygramma]
MPVLPPSPLPQKLGSGLVIDSFEDSLGYTGISGWVLYRKKALYCKTCKLVLLDIGTYASLETELSSGDHLSSHLKVRVPRHPFESSPANLNITEYPQLKRLCVAIALVMSLPLLPRWQKLYHTHPRPCWPG